MLQQFLRYFPYFAELVNAGLLVDEVQDESRATGKDDSGSTSADTDLPITMEGYELSTPSTTAFFLNSWQGCSYGLACPPERLTEYRMVRTLRPGTDIRGLYLTGQDILVGGVTTQLGTANMTVQALIAEDSWYGGLIGLITKPLIEMI
jgi:phytoene dehydrogenase-like protein